MKKTYLFSFFFCLTLVFNSFSVFAGGTPQIFENEAAFEYVENNLPQAGILKSRDGFIYLSVDDRYVFDVFALLTQEGLQIPPYFKSHNPARAHISVIYEAERQALPPKISEFGQTFTFIPKEFYSVFVADHKEVYVLGVDSSELEALRTSYGLSPKLQGHDYHITVAIKNYPHNQVVMKELRCWYNGKWVESMKRHWDCPSNWPRKPYPNFKGQSDDHKHLTRSDLRKWWNTRSPGYYSQSTGYEDDDVVLTFDFLERWFKVVSPNGKAP